MPDISSIGHGSIGPINRAADRNGQQVSAPPQQQAERRGDAVELSPEARLLDRLRHLPEVRQELVDRIKREIEAGTYETPEKIDRALEGIIAEMREGIL